VSAWHPWGPAPSSRAQATRTLLRRRLFDGRASAVGDEGPALLGGLLFVVFEQVEDRYENLSANWSPTPGTYLLLTEQGGET
jgi:hypothetical protein